ncbi:MAG: FeoA family protein [Candidatus Kapaibacteriota bacterium]|jgi:Fe2+ transport system protein FeoA
MLLSEANNDEIVKIVSIEGGKGLKQKLLALGIHNDDIVQIVSNPAFGPILIKNLSKDNARIAIGRGIAQKIKVENVN